MKTLWILIAAGVCALATAVVFSYRVEEWLYNYPKVRPKDDNGV